MTFSVNFNRKPQFGAVEINNVMINRFLSIEVLAEHSFPLELFPEENFRKGAAAAQFSCKLFQVRFVRNDSLSHEIP